MDTQVADFMDDNVILSIISLKKTFDEDLKNMHK